MYGFTVSDNDNLEMLENIEEQNFYCSWSSTWPVTQNFLIFNI